MYGECWFTGTFYFKPGGSQNATLRGDRKECDFLENMVFSFHEFSTAPLSVHVIYSLGISGHVLNHFLGHEVNVVIDACGESKSVFSR